MSWLLSFVVASSVSHGPAVAPIDAASLVHPTAVTSPGDLLAASSRRIRSTERHINMLLTDGVRRSKTFADLVWRIHRTDLIVYVETSHDLAADTMGRLVLQGVAGGQRYLRVQVRPRLDRDQTIAVVAHELHHAIEVADDRAVVDEKSLTDLYRRIGHISNGARGFDTDGARATGLRVRGELIG